MKMNFRDFSTQLITTQDLDPDYVFMRAIGQERKLTQAEMVLWAIHKIFIYDTASEYLVMFKGRTIETLPHGAERRKNRHHTRRNLDAFLTRFAIADLPREYTEARKYLTQFPGVGDWAAWKFCDLMERVCDIPMNFSRVDFRTAYDYPLRGLCAVNNHPDSFVRFLKDDHNFINFMTEAWNQIDRTLKAPPMLDREINLQELETCLCKYHSYLSGHYKIGKDTAHLNDRFRRERIEIPVDLTKLHKTPLSL